jgi:hypothetical protein
VTVQLYENTNFSKENYMIAEQARGFKTHPLERKAISEKLILVFSFISTTFFLGWVLWLSNYGMDITDESFYIVWISNPFNYSVSATQFGFIYHPLYKLLDGDIVALRQVNIPITFCLAWMLSAIFLKNVFGSECLKRMSRYIIAGTIATSAILVFAGCSWLPPTPSYNSLALQALLIAATGFLLAEEHISLGSVTGWLLIGCGGWLAFMAKPTTAAALAVCTGAYLLFAGKLNLRLLSAAVAISLSLVVLSALSIDGSIVQFIDRLKGGAEMYDILSGEKTSAKWLRLDDFNLTTTAKILLGGCSTVFFAAAIFSQAKIRTMVHIATILSVSFAVMSLAVILGYIHNVFVFGPFQGFLLFSVPFAATLAGLTICRFRGLSRISHPQWALAFVFLVFPYVYAFGTGNNYWKLISKSGVFCFFSGLVLLIPIAHNRKLPMILLSLGLAAQLVTVAIVDVALDTPYRQPSPLLENTYKLDIGKPGSSLILSEDFGRYYTEAIELAQQAGLMQGTPVIDLTGQSPGILYAMGADNIGQVWTIGGYPGSDALAIAMLRRVTCEDLANSWLLIETEGPKKISTEILSSFGARLDVDYEIAGTLTTAKGAGGYSEPREQKLLKPVRPIAVATAICTSTRTSRQ